MRQIAYHVAASWINANAAVQLARDIRKVRGLPPRLRLSFVRYERCPHITQPTSLSPDGSFSMLPPRLLFCGLTMRQSSLELWSRRGSWRATIRPPRSQRVITRSGSCVTNAWSSPRTMSAASPFVFTSERGAPFTTAGFGKMIARAGEAAKLKGAHPHMLRHACGYALANRGHDTRALQTYLGHKNIQHTVRYTELSPTRFKNFWR